MKDGLITALTEQTKGSLIQLSKQYKQANPQSRNKDAQKQVSSKNSNLNNA
jgi:hypothetical protein